MFCNFHWSTTIINESKRFIMKIGVVDGFDILFPESVKACADQTPAQRASSELSLATDLVRIAEGVGVRRVRDPKKPTEFSPDPVIDLDKMIGEVGGFLGIGIKFPTPFANEYGLQTEFGIASYRSINALYQAYLIAQLTETFGRKVIEIGAGTGRTAYFASLLGASHYTIVDVPLTGVAQAIFLGAVFGEDAVQLAGEEYSGQRVSILSPADVSDYSGIVVNVDSMSEMASTHISEYIEKIREDADVFLSINHEAHASRIGQLASKDSKLYRRNMYSLRAGYLEELNVYHWPNSHQPIVSETGVSAWK